MGAPQCLLDWCGRGCNAPADELHDAVLDAVAEHAALCRTSVHWRSCSIQRYARHMAGSRLWLLFDLLLGIVFLGATLWIVGAEDAIYARGVHMSDWEKGLPW